MNIPAEWLNYWSPAELFTNLTIFLNILGALLLGLVVGYERSYHGRAAGMRTYGLVCMASCALTVISGFPAAWYGGGWLSSVSPNFAPDPTRVIQGIVTGIGFLGAGVIMREGLHISGLTTAASIWSASAIGIMVGMGFYATSIALAFLSAFAMMWGSKLEGWLPSHHAISIELHFAADFMPSRLHIQETLAQKGYAIAQGSFTVQSRGGKLEWRFVAVEISKHARQPLTELAEHLNALEGLDNFHIAYARN